MANTARIDTIINEDYNNLLEARIKQFNSPETDKNFNTIEERIKFREDVKGLGWAMGSKRDFIESAIMKMNTDIKTVQTPWLKREFKL